MRKSIGRTPYRVTEGDRATIGIVVYYIRFHRTSRGRFSDPFTKPEASQLSPPKEWLRHSIVGPIGTQT